MHLGNIFSSRYKDRRAEPTAILSHSNDTPQPPHAIPFNNLIILKWSCYAPASHLERSTADIAMGNGTKIGLRFQAGVRHISLLHSIQTGYGVHPMDTRGLSSRRSSGRGVNLTPHFHLQARQTKCGSIHPLPGTSSWRGA
jgi:hypothetical protein